MMLQNEYGNGLDNALCQEGDGTFPILEYIVVNSLLLARVYFTDVTLSLLTFCNWRQCS